MTTTLAALAQLVGGRVLGDETISIEGAATMRNAGPTDITLADTQDKAERLAQSRARAAIVPKDVASPAIPAIQVDDVHRAFAAIVTQFRPRRAVRRGVSPLAEVSPTARLADDVEVAQAQRSATTWRSAPTRPFMPGAHHGRLQLAERVTIFPDAVLYENTIVGPRVMIHAGAVLGGYGFGYKLVDGRHVLSAQLGNVLIGADVEIGAAYDDRPRHLRPDHHRRRHEDRQSRDDRPQLPHRPAQPDLLAGRHRRQHDHRRLRRDGRPGRRPRSRAYRRPGGARRNGRRVQRRARRHAHARHPGHPEREQKVLLAAISKLPEMRQQFKQFTASRSTPWCKQRDDQSPRPARRSHNRSLWTPPSPRSAWSPAGAAIRSSSPRRLSARACVPTAWGSRITPIPRWPRSATISSGSAWRSSAGDPLLSPPRRARRHDGRQDPQGAAVRAAAPGCRHLPDWRSVRMFLPHFIGHAARPQGRHAAAAHRRTTSPRTASRLARPPIMPRSCS